MRLIREVDRIPTQMSMDNGHVVVIYHVTLVAIGHGLLNKCWPFGSRLRSTYCREFHDMKLCRPAYFVSTTQFLPPPGHK